MGLGVPTVIVTSAASVRLLWPPVTTPNGVITAFEVFRIFNGVSLKAGQVGGSAVRQMEVEGLIPLQTYSFFVRARNAVGHVDSDPVRVHMPRRTPQGMKAPLNLTALSSTSILVLWRGPTQPAGVIDKFQVDVTRDGKLEQRIGVEPSSGTMQKEVDSLKPFTRYQVT